MDFDAHTIQIDAETISQDFDDIDLYGEKLIEDEEESDLQFE